MSNGSGTAQHSLLTANSVVLTMPSMYNSVSMEINGEGTERNVEGLLIKERVATKMQITIEWQLVTKAEKDAIVSATSGNTFSCSYYDTQDDTFKSGTFYRGNDFTCEPLLNYRSGSGFPYYRVYMTLIEV